MGGNGGRRFARILETIRAAIRTGAYEVTIPHFLQEMAADDLIFEEVETAILTGSIVRRFKDPSGARYVIRGKVPDGRLIEVVGRLKAVGRLLLITVYELRENDDESNE